MALTSILRKPICGAGIGTLAFCFFQGPYVWNDTTNWSVIPRQD